MVAKALEVFGPRWILGYDIGCSFAAMISQTSLNEVFQSQGHRTCVNAFHGYSHNALCQQLFHPNNIEGMGLEDLETLERIFSQSNQLATVTRYMSPYRRRVFIDLFFQQWDREKYQNLASMLHNNYVQALSILNNDAKALAADLEALNLTEDDLKRWWQDQGDHFKQLGAEDEGDVSAVHYVELLQKLRDLECISFLKNPVIPLTIFTTVLNMRIVNHSEFKLQWISGFFQLKIPTTLLFQKLGKLKPVENMWINSGPEYFLMCYRWKNFSTLLGGGPL